jgi:hypothetical protein
VGWRLWLGCQDIIGGLWELFTRHSLRLGKTMLCFLRYPPPAFRPLNLTRRFDTFLRVQITFTPIHLFFRLTKQHSFGFSIRYKVWAILDVLLVVPRVARVRSGMAAITAGHSSWRFHLLNLNYIPVRNIV